jgi:hypothetical protein
MKDVILAAQPNKRFVEFSQLTGLLLYLASDMGGLGERGGPVDRRRLDAQ